MESDYVLMGGGDVEPPSEPTCSQKASAWGLWAVSHPKGQLAMLFLFTLPLGIWGLVNSQKSYDALSEAVSDFDKILVNWRQVPFTKVKVISRDSQCSTQTEGGVAYVDFGGMTWPGANPGPCACPLHANQVMAP